nr:MAG: helix-turn-helix domain protein [Bacteriophage sp.]
MKLSEKIKLYRKKNKMTKSELARLINVSPSYITKLENGEKENPSLEVKIKIANVLGCSVSELGDLSLFAGTGKLIEGFYGKYFAEIENKNEEEINLLYNLLKIRYGEENITMNSSIDNEFLELNIGDKTIVYTKQEFEKFIDHVSTLFPTFKMILDSSKTK